MARILMPLPDRDFDVTEVAVPWRLLQDAGHSVVFATEQGAVAAADPLLLEGVLFGQLGAQPEPCTFYREMRDSPAFLAPIQWADVDPARFDALWLAGGHAPGMRQYLDSAVVQAHVRDFFARSRLVAAICHGVLVAARAGVLSGRRTTCLPQYMERTAYWLTAWKLGRYYRTYDRYVEDEVRASGAVFERGPIHLVARGTRDDDGPAFVVEDGAYMSGRWPGDAYALSKRLLQRLTET